MDRKNLILLTLYRKTVTDNTYNDIESNQENQNCFQFMATDYFDIVEVQHFSLNSNSLLDIIDKEISNTIAVSGHNEVAIQSFLLSSSEDIDEELFNDKLKDMSYISTIQIHITPEVIARVKDSEKYGCVENSFYKNLFAAAEEFKNNYIFEFKYQIFSSLSTGDFTVILRSKKADTSFLFSKKIREITDSVLNRVFYKTFTLLGIKNAQIFNKNIEDSKYIKNKITKDDVLVIRCCYSNKYWSDLSSRNELLLSKIRIYNNLFGTRIFSLNGRYNFFVQLSEFEFAQIFTTIEKKKGINFVLEKNQNCDEEHVFDEVAATSVESDNIDLYAYPNMDMSLVEYIVFLLEKDYLSYINERYILTLDNKIYDSKKYETEIEFSEDAVSDKYLSDLNSESLNKLIDFFKIVEQKLYTLNGYRKNINYHVRLIHKLIVLCKTINGLSDTRIYSRILMKQLAFVLKGLYNYCDLHYKVDYYWKESGLIDDIEQNLQTALNALDSYAKYIRDNNLQTLQTPNYSLESNIGMDKFLVAYGEFSDMLINWINRNNDITHDDKKEFLPIVVPDLSNNAISIEVLFPDINMEDDDKNARLMLIKCSSLRDLSNLPYMVTALFHEVAHRFRYEERKNRNEMIIKFFSMLIFDSVIEEINNSLTNNVPHFVKYYGDFDIGIERVLANNYVRLLYQDERYNSNINSMSMRKLMSKLQSDFEELVAHHEIVQKTKIYSKKLVDEIKYHIDLEQNLEIVNSLVQVYCFVDDVINICKTEENDSIVKEKVDIKIAGLEESLNAIEKLNLVDEERRFIFVIKYYLLNVSDIVNVFKDKIIFDNILEESYEEIHKIFIEKIEKLKYLPSDKDRDVKVGGFRDSYRYLARFLQIDYNLDENKEKFCQWITQYIYTKRKISIEYAISFADEYREQTSDLFMFNLLNLNPFGYLNFLAYVLPIDKSVDIVYARRCYFVLNAVTENKLSDEKNIESFFSLCCEILTTLKKSVLMLIENMGESYDILLDVLQPCTKNMYKQKFNLNKNIFDTLKFSKCLDDIVMLCIEFRKRLSDKNSNEIKGDCVSYISLFSQYESICKILMEIIKNYWDFIGDIKQYNFVHDNLTNGAKTLKELYKRFENNALWKNYCSAFSKYLKQPYIKYNNNCMNELNKSAIDFILDMYYKNKTKIGTEILKGEPLYDKDL